MIEMQTIGILGGMGPEASADVYLKIIQRAYQYASAKMKYYPHILINNLPIPNIFQRPSKETGVYLGEQARILEDAGAKAIGIACNSAHYFWSYMREAVTADAWVVNMIDEVVKRVKKDRFKHISVLSSSMARLLYIQTAASYHLELTTLQVSEQEQIDGIIARILAGNRSNALKAELMAVAENQMNCGAQCVVLGCTDLPIVLKQEDVDYPLYASNDILADVLFEFAVSER